jgi:phosphoinositide-3-kinase regulatory subunit 4
VLTLTFFIRLLKKYGALLVHPSADVRYFAIATVNAVCESLDYPDGEVFVVPVLRPFLRYQPSPRHLTTREGLESCLHPPWTREKFQEELNKFLSANGAFFTPATGWTSISLQIGDGVENSSKNSKKSSLDKDVKADGETSNDNKVDSQTEQVCSYLQMLARSRTYSEKDGSEGVVVKAQLAHVLEGSLKLAQQIKFPRQDNPGSHTASLPSWYNTLRETQESQSRLTSETAAIRSVSALGQVYGLSIMDQSSTTTSSSADMTTDRATGILQSDESKMIQAACSGEWGAETRLDPALTDTTLLVTKLNALQVPPLPPQLSDDRISSRRAAAAPQTASKEPSNSSTEWKPRIDTVVASSRTSSGFGHTAPVVRLVASNDQRFFATGSHDGTCRVWEMDKAEKCNGILESSITYSGHLANGNVPNPRINDLAVLEGSHSVCSAASDGSIHVWRVDMVSSTKQSSSSANETRVAGSSRIRQMNHEEGEILAVNHFNTSSASILTFATQKGFIHSWDLRSATEPFLLKNPHDTGYITSCTVGSDRNWVVTGTSRGFVALWDLRFQQILKLWHHSRSAPINRLGTSIVPAPQSWTGRSTSETRPFLFAAAGPNECAMFDITTGACRECFRTIDYGGRYSSARLDEIPRLDELPLSTSARRRAIMSQSYGVGVSATTASSSPSINAMVGSIGASNHSFLLTGGSDGRIRHWDFSVASKCYVSSGIAHSQPRPSFERIDHDHSCRLMLCRQPPRQHMSEVESSRVPKKLCQGLKKPENCHRDSIQDLKVVRSGLLSCSRDCTVKLWR